jgi:hypothetical protein
MRGPYPGGRLAPCVSMIALSALLLPLGAQAATHPAPTKAPHVTTGPALHVLGTSAQLTASINPRGIETTYYFQYGLTTAYTSTSPTGSAGSGSLKIKVGQPVSGLVAGATYHYRVVATNAKGTSLGKDRIFGAKGRKLKFIIPKPGIDVFGSPIIFSGSLFGFASANHRIVLQASPYPFLESFADIGIPGITDRNGRFSFRIANLSGTTQLRVITLDAFSVYSPVVTLRVAARVNFRVRSSGHAGLARLYGTVMPAVRGAKVYLQLQRPVRPGTNSEATTRYITQFVTGVKHGGKTFSRFSVVVKILRGGRYRAFVKAPRGPVVSGTSSRTFVLHAAPTTKK